MSIDRQKLIENSRCDICGEKATRVETPTGERPLDGTVGWWETIRCDDCKGPNAVLRISVPAKYKDKVLAAMDSTGVKYETS